MKYRLCIEETVKFSHEIVIEVDESQISDARLNKIIDKAEGDASRLGWETVIYDLERWDGIEVIESVEDSSGDIDELSITDFYEEVQNES